MASPFLFWYSVFYGTLLVLLAFVFLAAPDGASDLTQEELDKRKAELKAAQEQYDKELKLNVREQEYRKKRSAYNRECEKIRMYHRQNDPYEKWKRTFMCLACGHRFIPKENA